MPQANFAYAPAANDPAGLPLAVSIYADNAELRARIEGEAVASGFRVAEAGALALLLEGEARALGAVVLADCPAADAAGLAALARLDLRAAHCGARLIVATTLAALEDVFGCLDQSNPRLLIDPDHADLIRALGECAAAHERSGSNRLRSPGVAFKFAEPCPDERLTAPALPDPKLVRRHIRERQMRARFFAGELFADPAWDMLLDLTAARGEQASVSVTSLCIASGVPPTTALRWIGQMIEAGLLRRTEDLADRRRAFIALSDSAADAMAGYFARLGVELARAA